MGGRLTRQGCTTTATAQWRWRAGLTSLLLLLPTVAAALGLGELQVSSGLNQRLEGRIPLVAVSAEDIDSIRASLADAEALERAGIERSRFLLGLRFEVKRGAGGDHVRVYSSESLREPVLRFIVEVAWPGGRALREYSLLLTPPRD